MNWERVKHWVGVAHSITQALMAAIDSVVKELPDVPEEEEEQDDELDTAPHESPTS